MYADNGDIIFLAFGLMAEWDKDKLLVLADFKLDGPETKHFFSKLQNITLTWFYINTLN